MIDFVPGLLTLTTVLLVLGTQIVTGALEQVYVPAIAAAPVMEIVHAALEFPEGPVSS